MSKDKNTTINTDHEIEELLQKLIVEKIASVYEESMIGIKNDMFNLQKEIDSIKNASNSTSSDISVLIQNDDSLKGDVGEIDEKVDKITKTIKSVNESQAKIFKSMPNNEKIVESLSTKWREVIDEKIELVHESVSNSIDKIEELSNPIDGIDKNVQLLTSTNQEALGKIELLVVTLDSMKELLHTENNRINELEILAKKIEDTTSKTNDELDKNGGIITQELYKLNRRLNILWITVGIDTILILGILMATFLK